MDTASITRIHLDEEARIRAESYGDIEELATNLFNVGQLQRILVRPFHAEEFPGLPEGSADWTVVAGGRRYLAVQHLLATDRAVKGLGPGEIRIDIREEVDDALENLLHEFYENESREDFTWAEKARFCRRLHEALVERAGDRPWNVDLTAIYLKMNARTLYAYLELTDDESIFEDEDVQKADSFRAARKKVQVKKEKGRRKKIAEARSKSEDHSYFSTAAKLITHADCREWIKTFPDNHFHWAHWDPPYGGEQEGGAFTSNEDIDDSPEYAEALISEMVPELARVLAPGSWLAIWFHQSKREWLRKLLTEAGFWVNPYECIWYKRNRRADGHEITRFLVNAYEPFFLAALPPEPGALPVLAKSSAQNVFPFDMVEKSVRRHIMHKPADLIGEIIKIISLGNEVGVDPSVGSGSSVEASITVGRPMLGCEASEHYHLAAVEATARLLEKLRVSVGEIEAPEEVPDEEIIL